MSEASEVFFAPRFNRSVKVGARDQRLSSDGGVLLLREADERLGLVESLASRLHDPRDQAQVRYHLDEILRQRIFSRALGYNADDEVDLLAHDPAMRICTWNRPGDRVLEERGASQSTQSRLTDTLSGHKGNLEATRRSLPDWVERHLRASGRGHAVRRGTLDVDSLPMEVRGSQQGAAYNGYYKKKIYHPLVAAFAPDGNYDSKRQGDGFVHAILRAGNVHTACGAKRFIHEAMRRASGLAVSLDVRMDAGFTTGSIMDSLTAHGIRFVGRLRTNKVLEKLAERHLRRPAGRPPQDGYDRVIDLGDHQAESWRYAQRLILVVVDRPDAKTGQLELVPRHFFLVTNWSPDDRTKVELLEHYRRRGTFEDRLGEMSGAIAPRLSSPLFAENEVHLLLSLLSYNLLSMLRGELESKSENGWDVSRLQRTVLKTAVRITKGGRRILVDVALSAVALWNRLIGCMDKWKPASTSSRPTTTRPRKWRAPPRHAFRAAVLKD